MLKETIIIIIVHCCTALWRCDSARIKRHFLYNKHIAWRIQMYLSGRRGCSSRSTSEICCSSPARKVNRGTFIVMSSFHNENCCMQLEKYFHSISPRLSLSLLADLLHYKYISVCERGEAKFCHERKVEQSKHAMCLNSPVKRTSAKNLFAHGRE